MPHVSMSKMKLSFILLGKKKKFYEKFVLLSMRDAMEIQFSNFARSGVFFPFYLVANMCAKVFCDNLATACQV